MHTHHLNCKAADAVRYPSMRRHRAPSALCLARYSSHSTPTTACLPPHGAC